MYCGEWFIKVYISILCDSFTDCTKRWLEEVKGLFISTHALSSWACVFGLTYAILQQGRMRCCSVIGWDGWFTPSLLLLMVSIALCAVLQFDWMGWMIYTFIAAFNGVKCPVMYSVALWLDGMDDLHLHCYFYILVSIVSLSHMQSVQGSGTAV